ncbi:hypothetical protein PM082_009959 [Marasmius tenuissimus]|nr:hypothetical protein PM082_009959 [Marasmius tenuissimus]
MPTRPSTQSDHELVGKRLKMRCSDFEKPFILCRLIASACSFDWIRGAVMGDVDEKVQMVVESLSEA